MLEFDKIWRKDAAQELGISLSSLDRAVKAGELRYANWDAPKGAHRYFTQADLENYACRKPLEQRKAADILEKLLDGTLSIEDSPLGELTSKHLLPLPLDIVVEIKTLSPGEIHHLYACKFPLLRREFVSPEAHSAAVLALAYLISREGGVCKSRDFAVPDTTSSSWGPEANRTLQEIGDDIVARTVTYAHAWVADGGAFERAQKSNLSHFVRGTGCGGGSVGKCIVLDHISLYTPRSGNYLHGTTVTAYLTVPLP